MKATSEPRMADGFPRKRAGTRRSGPSPLHRRRDRYQIRKSCESLPSRVSQKYFFQVHSGTKLATRMTTKADQKRFQSNEMTESRFNAPMMLRTGKRIPSILQWTLPQDRAFVRQPVPAHATATTQTTSLAVSDNTDSP